MRFKQLVSSWDLWAGVVAALISFAASPRWVTNGLAKDLYSTAISVLSILFSVFFASLAMIMASSGDDFVDFLEERGDYSKLIWTFQFSLGLLFVALLASLVLFAYAAGRQSAGVHHQSSAFLTILSFLFFYALFAAALTVHDAIAYSRLRAKYLEVLRKRTKSN